MILKKITLFSELSSKELKEIKALVNFKTYTKGSFIIHEGEIGDKTFFVEKGKVKIFKTSREGREQILGIKVKGEIFGEVTLLNPVRYPATAQALEDSCIGYIHNKNLENYIKNNPNVALNLIKTLNKNLLEAQQKIKSLAVKNAYSRAARELLNLSKKFGVNTPDGIRINVLLTRKELADMIGTSRETISRIIAEFKKEKTIKIINRYIYVPDIEKLKDWI